MLRRIASLPDRLRRPEYTGENRCVPCTVVNSAIALAVAAVASVEWLPAGPVVLVVSAGVIYFRGYLVPGTPTLTKRYFPSWLLRAFGKTPTGSAGPRPAAVNRIVFDSGTVTDDGGEVTPHPRFDDACRRELDGVAGDLTDEDLAATLGVGPDELEYTDHDDRVVVTHEGDVVGDWPTETAALADVAIARAFEEWSDEWPDLSPATRTAVLRRLRPFVDTCPDCGGPVELTESTIDTCCDTLDAAVAKCSDCSSRVFEVPNVEG